MPTLLGLRPWSGDGRTCSSEHRARWRRRTRPSPAPLPHIVLVRSRWGRNSPQPRIRPCAVPGRFRALWLSARLGDDHCARIAEGESTCDQPAGRRHLAVPPPARREPRRLVGVGRRRVRRGARAQRPGAAERGVRRVPLVPRDGPRVLRGRADRGVHERALRQHQGRPRGATGRGRGLHGRHPGDDRARRLADDLRARPRGDAVLRGDLLPGPAAARQPELPAGARGAGRGLARPRRRGAAGRRRHPRAPARPGRPRERRHRRGDPGRPR